MWKVVDGFVTGQSKHREIVSAVLSGEDDRYMVDGRHMNVRVPDMLLRTCEREIQRVGIRCTRVNEIWIPGLESHGICRKPACVVQNVCEKTH